MGRVGRQRQVARVPRLFAPTDPARGRDPLWLASNLPAGSVIIIRHYEWPPAARLELAREVLRLARPRRVRVTVARDVDVAIAARADGFHAPEALGHRIAAFRRVRPLGLCTMAAHGRKGIVAAARVGADAVLLSRVFASASHPDAPAMGVTLLAGLVAESPVPVIALGGIALANARRLTGSGVHGLAIVGGIAGFISR